MIQSQVAYTTYEASKTKAGKPCLVVSYHCVPYEVVREWLFPGSGKLIAWWNARTSAPLPGSLTDLERACRMGKVRPTKQVSFDRDGRWFANLRTEVGEYPDALVAFVREWRELDPGCEVVEVRI